MTNRTTDLAIVIALLLMVVLAAVNPSAPTPTINRPGQAAPDAGSAQADGATAPASDHPASALWTVERAPRLPDGISQPPREIDPHSLTADTIDACIEVAMHIDPAMGRRMQTLRHDAPDQFNALLQKRGYRLLQLAELRDTDRALYDLKIIELKLDAQVREVIGEIRNAQAGGKEAQVEVATKRLSALLGAQYAIALKAREDYICRLKEHVEELEHQLQRDLANADDIVEQRVAAIVAGEDASTAAAATASNLGD
jgi:hypothetical protein